MLRELFEEAENAVLRAARLVGGERVALGEGLLLQVHLLLLLNPSGETKC